MILQLILTIQKWFKLIFVDIVYLLFQINEK